MLISPARTEPLLDSASTQKKGKICSTAACLCCAYCYDGVDEHCTTQVVVEYRELGHDGLQQVLQSPLEPSVLSKGLSLLAWLYACAAAFHYDVVNRSCTT